MLFNILNVVNDFFTIKHKKNHKQKSLLLELDSEDSTSSQKLLNAVVGGSLGWQIPRYQSTNVTPSNGSVAQELSKKEVNKVFGGSAGVLHPRGQAVATIPVPPSVYTVVTSGSSVEGTESSTHCKKHEGKG
ncbi:hypothetical protein ACSLBF_18670 (plasmid) [Pseudoalteromonas sp. T1lg65]|uniref:hypothetical protein n=1 Tax=Pseudoalteromonas sp. T1lg65 TaxID=2077101 RepID=UPI003F7A607B